MIKAVKLNYQPGTGDIKFEIGKEYESNDGFHFCDSAFATLEYEPFKNPLKTRYLEIKPLDEYSDIGDRHKHSFVCKRIKILREINRDELCQSEPKFRLKHSQYFDLSQKEFDKLKLMLDINGEVSRLKGNTQSIFKLVFGIAFILLATVILFYLI